MKAEHMHQLTNMNMVGKFMKKKKSLAVLNEYCQNVWFVAILLFIRKVVLITILNCLPNFQFA